MIIAILQNILLLSILVISIKELKPMLKWAFNKGDEENDRKRKQ